MNKLIGTYKSTSLVVMQVDRGARVVTIFQRVHKLFSDSFSKVNIVTATSPNPSTTTFEI